MDEKKPLVNGERNVLQKFSYEVRLDDQMLFLIEGVCHRFLISLVHRSDTNISHPLWFWNICEQENLFFSFLFYFSFLENLFLIGCGVELQNKACLSISHSLPHSIYLIILQFHL